MHSIKHTVNTVLVVTSEKGQPVNKGQVLEYQEACVYRQNV